VSANVAAMTASESRHDGTAELPGHDQGRGRIHCDGPRPGPDQAEGDKTALGVFNEWVTRP
jgi:hypothetical protein